MRSRFRRTATRTAKNRNLRRTVTAVVLGACGLLLSTVGASADPSISNKRQQAQAIIEEIATLDEEVGAAAERYNAANYELTRITARLVATRTDLRRARELRKASQRRIAVRLRQLYVNGEGGSSIEALLDAKSLLDILDRIDLVKRAAKQDADIAEEATALRKRVAKRESELAAARSRQTVVLEQRADETRAIHANLTQRQRLLASMRDEIAQLEEAERRRQLELQRQARLELERQRAVAAAAERAREQTAMVQQAPASPIVEGDETGSEAPASPPPAPPADASAGAKVVSIAMQYVGVPYRWGGASPSSGFDCSGLTMYVFAQIGVSLPHYAAAQYGMGVAVAKEELQPGDLVFFRDLGHMGMYIGGGNFIHAPRTGDVVKISSLSESYYAENWVGARRVL